MTTDVISPGEAWEALERLKGGVSYNDISNLWCATPPYAQPTKFMLGWGATPQEAIADLLMRMGEAATARAEAANV